MEINQAKLTLEQAIASPSTTQGVVQALRIALDLLNETFKAQFISLETAQKEANDLAVAKNKAEQDKLEALNLKDSEIARITSETNAIIEEKEKTIATITSEKEAEAKRSNEAEAIIAEKIREISVLNEQLQLIKLEATEVNPIEVTPDLVQ
jgi:hypothetical protein